MGWHEGRSVPHHLARQAWLGADQPAWPAALEAWSQVGGLTLRVASTELTFDLACVALAGLGRDPVIGRWGGAWVSVDADGAIWVGDDLWATDIAAAVAKWQDDAR
jgi:hypothetical protein